MSERKITAIEVNPRKPEVEAIIIAASKAHAKDGRLHPIELVIDTASALAMMARAANLSDSEMRMVFGAAIRNCPSIPPMPGMEDVKFHGIGEEEVTVDEKT